MGHLTPSERWGCQKINLVYDLKFIAVAVQLVFVLRCWFEEWINLPNRKEQLAGHQASAQIPRQPILMENLKHIEASK